MSDLSETKVCPFCAETIKAAAKLCPFCRSRQSRFASWGHELLMALTGLAFVACAFWAIARLNPFESETGGRSFSRHKTDLAILNPVLDFTQPSTKFWLNGSITNQGKYPWRVHELEVRFLDQQGNLLDVRHQEVKDKFVVQPGQDHAFHLELFRLTFTNNPMQVRVQEGSDGDRLLKPE